MAETTQDVASLIHFDDMIAKSLREPMRGHEGIALYQAVLLLALSTGLEMSFIFTFKWNDLLSLGSENDAKVKDELSIRKYSIPLHPKVKQLLSQVYAVLGFPKLDSLIIERLQENTSVEFNRLPEFIIRTMTSNHIKFLKMDDALIAKFNFDECSQVYFGRRVFKVSGYTNETCRALKQHLGIRSNQALFDFLGYSSKDEIDYRLHHINLDCHAPIEFKDKNFNDGFIKAGEPKHPFQKFTAFSKFLLTGKTYYSETVTNSIYLLLWTSLYNGVRPSTLIRLEWKHILQVDKTGLSIEIFERSVFEGYTLVFGKELRDKLLYQFELYAEKTSINTLEPTEKRYKVKYKVIYKNLPELNTPVFIMNTGNTITQPSLSREIKKGLVQMGFPHSDKFTSKSTAIMYGRRVLEIKGNHKPTIQKLKEHFNFKSTEQLFDFLYLDYNKDGLVFERGKMRKNMFEEVLYDI